MAGMTQILSMERLPAAPGVMARVVPLLLDPGSGWDELERVVRQDQALTAAVLRLANSARYGTPGKQFDLRRAMMRLGRDELRRCILEQQVSGVVSGENAAYGLRRGALWRSALGGAIVAEHLAVASGSGEGPLAFLCALLRDIGKLALDAVYGTDLVAMIAGHEHVGGSFVEAELEALGVDHAQVGGALARRWHLPERIACAIEAHHQPPGPGPGHDALFDIVHAADTICRWAGLGVGIDGMDYRLAEHVRESLRMDRKSAEREIAFLWDELRDAEASVGQAGIQGAAA